jgi:phosphatidate cytidylyltransferase
VGFLLAHALALRQLDGGADQGRDWLLFALLVTFATDTGAFFTGRAVGRHRMAPTVSPGKTWEGAFGGFACAVGVALALEPLLGLEVPLWQAALIGAAVGLLAQAGDLAESRLKRAARVKDTGGILPGHGGVLDRLDSIVFTVPVVYYLVALVLEPSG